MPQPIDPEEAQQMLRAECLTHGHEMSRSEGKCCRCGLATATIMQELGAELVDGVWRYRSDPLDPFRSTVLLTWVA